MRCRGIQIIGGGNVRKKKEECQTGTEYVTWKAKMPSGNRKKKKVEKEKKGLAFLKCYQYNGLKYYQTELNCQTEI